MKDTAIYALTRKGAALGRFLAGRESGDLFLTQNLASEDDGTVILFDSLMEKVGKVFNDYRNHIFITAAGIAVRTIAPCIRSKDLDPAVVVLDQRGQYCISLLSGHMGRANELALRIASLTGGQAVITTATDTEGLLSIDVLAMKRGMAIANINGIKHINSAILKGEPIQVFDSDNRLGFMDHPPEGITIHYCKSEDNWVSGMPGIWVDWHLKSLPRGGLLLNPRCLVAGIGCNRGTSADEIAGLIRQVLSDEGISIQSLRALATVDMKKDETGLIEAAARLGIHLVFFSREQIENVDVPHPSLIVKRHMGVKSVCEATAILCAGKGRLIIPKRKSRNATLAVALEH